VGSVLEKYPTLNKQKMGFFDKLFGKKKEEKKEDKKEDKKPGK
jgi:hypothetical protein